MSDSEERPLVRKILDNPWVLLALGLLIPILSYTVWGWIEIMLLPSAQLP